MRELEDQPWFPTLLRNFQTDHIGFLVSRWPVYDPFISYLRSRPSPPVALTDLCSGSGEPAITVFKESQCFTRLTLTDKYPRSVFNGGEGIVYDQRSVDARTIPLAADVCYTLFNAFHHFSGDEQRALVRRLRAESGGAYVVEVLEPTAACFLKVLLATTVGTVLLAPFIKPFSFARLFFTWFVPVNVLTIAWDGLVSVVRSRSVRYYRWLLKSEAGRVGVMRLPHRWFPLVLIHITPP